MQLVNCRLTLRTEVEMIRTGGFKENMNEPQERSAVEASAGGGGGGSKEEVEERKGPKGE